MNKFDKLEKLLINASFRGDKYIVIPLNMISNTYEEIKSWCGENDFKCNLLKGKTSIRIEWGM